MDEDLDGTRWDFPDEEPRSGCIALVCLFTLIVFALALAGIIYLLGKL